MAVAGDLEFFKGKAMISTVDYLEADRLEFHYRVAAQVQRNRAVEAISLVFSMHRLY